MIPNLDRSKLNKLISRIEALERANPLSNSSLGRGQMRFYNGSVLLIENGALRVTGSATISGLLDVTGRAEISGLLDVSGTASISGILDVSGHTTLSGDTTIAGPTGITGKLTIQGDTDVTGKLNITGDTKLDGNTEITGKTVLKNELEVQQGKKITLGGLVLENQGLNSAQVQMPGGGISAGGGLGMSILHDTINIGGQSLVRIDTPDLRLGSIQQKAGAEANVHIDSSGRLWRAA